MNLKLQRLWEDYCNWSSLKTICITSDIDFAPDYMIGNIVSILSDFNAGATFFATHNSKMLQELSTTAEFEVGIHPNLLPTSTQGRGMEEITERLTAFYPAARGNRFHVLGYSYRDLIYLGKKGFNYDVSTIRFNTPYLLPAWHVDLNMNLLTYFWEDGVCENMGVPLELESIDITSPGMKIINFHPLNVYLNCATPEARLSLLSSIPTLFDLPEAEARKHRRHEVGAQNFLNSVLELAKTKGVRCITLREFSQAFSNAIK